MGGAAGHMAHPFDCREVRNGQDLINFYIKAVNTIPLYQGIEKSGQPNPASVKLDGVNASFRLQKTSGGSGFMFVHDRGATSDRSDVGRIDYAGITPDNALERFKNPEHGMIQVVNLMSKVLNHDLMRLKPYIEALGVFENGIGPEGVSFNAEFYSNADEERNIRSIKNVTDYNQSFIAIHGLQDFHTEETISKRGKTTTSRKTRGYYWQTQDEINELLNKKDQLQTQGQDISEVDALIAEKNRELYKRQNEHQEILNKLGNAIAENANTLDLPINVHTKIGLQFKEGLTREDVLRKIEEELNKPVPYNYKKIDEHKSIGPTVINEQTGMAQARSLKDLLLQVKQNPAHVAYYPDEFKKTNKDGTVSPATADVKVNSEFSQRHANKAGKPLSSRQSAFAKKIYMDVMEDGPKTGLGVGDVAVDDDDKSFEAINSAVILWHAVRKIGNVLKESVVADTDLGLPMSEQEGIVIQSEKMCDGITFKFTGEFIVEGSESEFRKDTTPQLNENKIKYGELLESFAIEAFPVHEQQEQYVILIPGGFKPPTGGHYSMIKQYEKKSNIVKVFVVTGQKPREGITFQQSKAIFDIYGGFSDKVEFKNADAYPSPTTACYELIKNPKFTNQFSGASFSLGAGDKGGDPERIQALVEYFKARPELVDVEVVAYPPAEALIVDGEPASASRMRSAFANGDWETFKKLLPNESFYDNVVQVLNSQIGGEAENFLQKETLFSLVDEVLFEEKTKASKAGQQRVSKKIGYLVGKEKKDQAHAAAIAYSMEKRGELEKNRKHSVEEEKENNETLTEIEEDKLRGLIYNLVNNIIKTTPELNPVNVQDAGDDFEEVRDTIVSTILDQIKDIAGEYPIKDETGEEIEESASMSGGAIAGFSGNLGPNKKEQKNDKK